LVVRLLGTLVTLCRSLALLARLLTAALLLGRASDPALDSGPVDFGSSWFFLSWEHRTNGPHSGLFLTKKKCVSPYRNHVSLRHSGLRFLIDVLPHQRLRRIERDWLTPRGNVSGSAIIIRTHNYRPTNKREPVFGSNH